jgi:oxalate decarboxylase/phosphoglucose isomerase-like protein (cupin superfamily)
MKTFKTGKIRGSFKLIGASNSVQAAIMTLKPGGASSGDLENEHATSEQWLFVLSGTGAALVRKSRGRQRRAKLAEGDLIWIEKGEFHQIKNTGKRVFRSINFYAPPAYNAKGPKATRLGNLAAELVAAAKDRLS